MWVLLVLVAILVVLIATIIKNGREYYGIIESGNIPVVPTSIFLGSEPDLHKKVCHLEDIKRHKKYGGIWGTYIGKSPQVHVTDPELIRLIFVKDADYFSNRQDPDFGTPVMNEILDYLPGEKWKVVRSLLSPLFTTSKLNNMSDVIAASAAEFIQDLKSEAKENNGRLKIDCRNRLTAWLIDMFAQTVLGCRMENSKDPNNKFVESFRQLMGEGSEVNLLYTLSLTFPFFARFAPMFNHEPTKYIESTFSQIMENRRKTGKTNTKDFVDLLNDFASKVDSPDFKRLGITDVTVLSQAVNFFLGGYETSGTTLSHLLLELAKNPEVQDKLKEELDDMLDRFDGKIVHDSIKDDEIPYALAVIKESLRLAPPLLRPERICTQDWHHKETGISIKKGTIVMIAAWAANRNPEVYPNPENFEPERFMPENKNSLNPYAFTTFGFGPRNCIGTRFAYESLKLFLCNLTKEFKVELRKDTKIRYKNGSTLLVAFDPLYLDLVLRD